MARSPASTAPPPPPPAEARPRDAGRYAFALYVVGTGAPSARAIVNVRRLCDEHLAGRYDLDVIDLAADPAAAAPAQVIAAPTLIKRLPPPVRRFIGDMSDIERVLQRLGLLPLGAAHEQ